MAEHSQRYKAYPEYKDSGVEWVGEIPSSWSVEPVFSVFDPTTEKNLDGKESNVLSLSYGNIIRRDVEKNFGLLPESFSTYQIVNTGDIILRLTDLQNDKRSLRVGLAKEKGIITSAYLKLFTKQGLNSRFAYRLLHSYDTTKVFYGLGGGLRQSMKFEDFRRLPILVPPLSEQEKIADFLDFEIVQLDTLIEKQQTLIQLLKEKLQAVISHAVTKGLNPDVPMKDSGVEWLGEVPAHWKVTKFSHCAQIRNGLVDPKVPDFKRLILYAPNHIEKGTGKIIYKETAENQGADSSKYLCYKGEIIYSKIRPALAKVAICQEEIALCSADMYPINAVSGLDNRFLYFFMLSDNFTKAAILDSDRVAMPKINRESLSDYRLPVPPVIEQREICEFIANQNTKLEELESKATKTIQLMQERRTALISAAVTGKIDVRGWVAPR